MAKNFEVSIQGLDELRTRLGSGRISKKTKLGLDRVSNHLQVAIGKAVSETYAIKDSARSVLLGKSHSVQTRGKNLQQIGLVYKFKPIALSKFPLKEVSVSAQSKFLIPRAGGGFKLVSQTSAKTVAVMIRKAGGFKTVVGRSGEGGFFRKSGNNSKWKEIQQSTEASSNYRRGIYIRKNSSSWNREPFSRVGTLDVLWGPSMSQMIATQMVESPLIARAIEDLPRIVLEHLDI